ncbi:MAG: siphovirus Gp157 family protein, partial [Pleurocapsa sp. MO_226.B13]|nr:siphovirus Gp157 family protein [Pleurocapsa sp. MO_226.B13]
MTRLWELSDEIQQLENAIALIADDDSLSDEDKETKLQETFAQWLETGESFKAKAEQVARYIRHTEAIAEARKTEARRIRELANQAENQAGRLR